MNDTQDQKAIYEIGYQIVSSVPEEKVSDEVTAIKNVITGAGASVIAEEAPRRQPLAYTMRKKTVAGSYEKYDQAYFGWIKFEVEKSKIESLTKKIELSPSILRSLTITTVRENTYLGKRASAVAASIANKPELADIPADKTVENKKETAPMSVEDVDKSIDEMIKEV